MAPTPTPLESLFSNVHHYPSPFVVVVVGLLGVLAVSGVGVVVVLVRVVDVVGDVVVVIINIRCRVLPAYTDTASGRRRPQTRVVVVLGVDARARRGRAK